MVRGERREAVQVLELWEEPAVIEWDTYMLPELEPVAEAGATTWPYLRPRSRHDRIMRAESIFENLIVNQHYDGDMGPRDVMICVLWYVYYVIKEKIFGPEWH